MKKYKCPKCGMNYDKPGKCTMDGATLVEVKTNHKHSKKHGQKHNHLDHHKMMAEDFKRRFIVSAIITIPILT